MNWKKDRYSKLTIDDRIKLKNYSGHSDYDDHNGEVAKIVCTDGNYTYFDCKIEWPDGSTSLAKFENMVMI